VIVYGLFVYVLMVKLYSWRT